MMRRRVGQVEEAGISYQHPSPGKAPAHTPSAAGPPAPSLQPRARGKAHLRLKYRDSTTRIADLRMAGASKLLFPRGAEMTAVVLNTSGGVTGGDIFRLRLDLQSGTHASVTTQAAERLYRAQAGETGTIATRLRVGPRARLNWLPQETIVFEGASVQRALMADVAADGELLAVEPLVFGRHAAGETLARACLTDRWTVRRNGALVFADRLRVAGAVTDLLRRIAGGAGAMASLLMVSPRADGLLMPLRALLGTAQCPGAANLLRPGVLFARLFAPCGFSLRQSLIPALEALAGRSLPRPWAL